jgi:hypothetical protein
VLYSIGYVYIAGDAPRLFLVMVTFGSDVVAQAPCASENGLNYNNKQEGRKKKAVHSGVIVCFL